MIDCETNLLEYTNRESLLWEIIPINVKGSMLYTEMLCSSFSTEQSSNMIFVYMYV